MKHLGSIWRCAGKGWTYDDDPVAKSIAKRRLRRWLQAQLRATEAVESLLDPA